MSGSSPDPIAAFVEAACAPRDAQSSGTIEEATDLLSRYPHIAGSSIYTAAILADESAVRRFLANDPKSAATPGGPRHWDALTYLCFSRYLRLDTIRSEAFVRTARVLLDAGASANTGWYETIDHPNPRQVLETALYGAAGVARHAGLTRLLLARGADPNDEETPYHAPETHDNTIVQILLESGKLNEASLACLLLRKTDWHDLNGLRLILEHGANPNLILKFGDGALHHAVRRDNCVEVIELLLDYGADPVLPSAGRGRTAIAMAARRGRSDVLALLQQRGVPFNLHGIDQLISACAMGDRAAMRTLVPELKADGGKLLADFAGNGNVDGIQCLLGLGVSADALYGEVDPYFDITRDSTALHVAAFRACPVAVKLLINRGAPVNALDSKGRSALALAVKACVDSYWMNRRSPESIRDLLNAGAAIAGVKIPCGYWEVDDLLLEAQNK